MSEKVDLVVKLIDDYAENRGKITNIIFLHKFNLTQLDTEWAPVVHALDRLVRHWEKEPIKPTGVLCRPGWCVREQLAWSGGGPHILDNGCPMCHRELERTNGG